MAIPTIPFPEFTNFNKDCMQALNILTICWQTRQIHKQLKFENEKTDGQEKPNERNIRPPEIPDARQEFCVYSAFKELCILGFSRYFIFSKSFREFFPISKEQFSHFHLCSFLPLVNYDGFFFLFIRFDKM